MTATTYANIESNVQATIYGIISADATVLSYLAPNSTKNILDGDPIKLIQGRGFPYITINNVKAEHGIDRMANTINHCNISLDITIVSNQESVVRSISGAVRNALRTNQNTTRGVKLTNFRVRSSSQTSAVLEPSGFAYIQTFSIGYKFNG